MLVHLGCRDIVETSFLLADNQSAISNLKTEQTHGRTKHMDLRYKFCGEELKLGEIKILYVRTEYNIADIGIYVQHL